MRAAWFDSFGTAADVLQVGEMATPSAGGNEILVRLQTSGVNPSDVKKRAGSFPNLLDDGRVIPNSDGAGIVEAVGENVDKGRIGQRVWVYQAQFARRFGTAAEYIAIDANRAAPLPDKTSFEVGACLGIPVMTAHRAVFADGDVKGQTLLITGGAGRVGYYAIQWARQGGAIVIATASNHDDRTACISAGAHHVINHRDGQLAKAVLSATKGALVDRVVDVEFGANLKVSVDVLKVGGVIATYSSTQVPEPSLPFFQMMYKDLTVRMIIVYAMPEVAKQNAISDIDSALRNNALHHRIACTASLDDIVAANETVEKGRVRGAVILNIE